MCKYFSILGHNDNFWKDKVKQDYVVKTPPPRFQERWRELFIYLMTKQKIPVRISRLLVSDIKANYRTPIREIQTKIENKNIIKEIHGKESIIEEIHRKRNTRRTIGKMVSGWIIKEKKETKGIITAMGREYPYRLILPEDWEQAYLEGIDEIGFHTFMLPYLAMCGLIIIKHGEERYRFPYGKKATLFRALNNLPLYVHPEERLCMLNNKKVKFFRLHIPELCINMIYRMKSHTTPAISDWNITSTFEDGTEYDDEATMKEIMETLGWEKNTQGIYPTLYGEVFS